MKQVDDGTFERTRHGVWSEGSRIAQEFNLRGPQNLHKQRTG
jgi:hypothetical protein